MRSFLSVVGALSALQLLSVAAQDVVPPCVAECAASLRGSFNNFQCGSADDKACLCAKPDFENGLRDCSSQKCGATPDNVKAYLANDLCVGLLPPAAAESSAAPAPESSAPPAAESSAPPAPESSAPPPAETSAPAETTSQPVSTSAPAESSAAPAATSVESSSAPASTTAESSEAAASETAAPSSTTLSTSTISSASAAATGAADTDKDKNEKDDSDESGSGGLSTAAKAGIAVGVIAVVIAVLGLILCLLGRKKNKPKPRAPLEISKPMPGSRSGYGPSDDASYEKYGDIEMTTRYEDMLPRQQPRTMV